ncbi:hypothetical protein FZEAL_10113 [Fusarium zealandicum]|uniref:F-box domain-containing protein n=1 Tax=Fusarium zealandicum TaxID=1053134 RepID=A0A8H4U5U1_9HYPO|nr:hypothetical protein FZEAL_10113 [Fusarium zealandicum]
MQPRQTNHDIVHANLSPVLIQETDSRNKEKKAVCSATMVRNKTPAKAPRPRAGFQQLPCELVNLIANSLSRPDLENFRLVSKAIAEYTVPQLALSHFNGLPWRQDGKRLHDLSLIPACARRIRSIKFNMTRMNEDYIEGAYMEADEEFLNTWGPYFETQGTALGPVHLPLDLVVPALMRLPNLDSVSLTWVEILWGDYGENTTAFAHADSVTLAGDEIFEVQQSIIEALRIRNMPLKSLTLEPLIHQKLTMPSTLDDWAINVFGSVERLHLVLDRNVEFMPDRFEHFVSLMPNLRKLRMDSYLMSDADLPLQMHFRHLEQLEVRFLKVHIGHFAAFLLRHAQSLKQISLRTMHGVDDPSTPLSLNWKRVFKHMSDDLDKLEVVRLSGRFITDTGEHMSYYRVDDLKSNQVYLPGPKDSAVVEKYIIEGGECPWL